MTDPVLVAAKAFTDNNNNWRYTYAIYDVCTEFLLFGRINTFKSHKAIKEIPIQIFVNVALESRWLTDTQLKNLYQCV